MGNVKVLLFLSIFILKEQRIYSIQCHYNKIKNRFFLRQVFPFNDTSKINPKNNKKRKRKKSLGSPCLSYIENIYEYKNIKFGYSLLKKPGEKLRIIPYKTIFLFNTNNEFLLIENISFIKKIIIGDFCIGFGQGLVFNNVSFYKKPLEQIKIIKIQRGIEKTNSHVVNKIKGFAGTFILIKRITATIFLGKNFIDGNISNKKISSAYRRLTYNTTQNTSRKNTIKESVQGFNISFNSKDDSLEIGLNFVKTTFDLPFKQQRKTSPIFQGNKNINYSYFLRYLIGPIHFALEHAFSLAEETAFTKKFGQGEALLCGFIANTIKNIDIAICFRKYTPNYYNFYGRSFCICDNANSSQLKGAGKNEIGLYYCTLIKIFHNLSLTYSYDTYKNPWQKYKYKSKTGHEHLLSLKYYQKKNYFYLSIKSSSQTIYTQQKKQIKKNVIYIKKELTFSHDSNTRMNVQIHVAFSKISKISAGIYACIIIHFKRTEISIFLLISKISENTSLYIRRKKSYREQGTMTTINTDVLTLGTTLTIKMGHIFLINILFEYNYKKQKNIPILKICLLYRS